jgi:hypothetical protein
MPEFTNVRLRTTTRDRLRDLGKKDEDYDHIVVRILDAFEKKPAEA